MDNLIPNRRRMPPGPLGGLSAHNMNLSAPGGLVLNSPNMLNPLSGQIITSSALGSLALNRRNSMIANPVYQGQAAMYPQGLLYPNTTSRRDNRRCARMGMGSLVQSPVYPAPAAAAGRAFPLFLPAGPQRAFVPQVPLTSPFTPQLFGYANVTPASLPCPTCTQNHNQTTGKSSNESNAATSSTKTVVIRGKPYELRKSFLEEAGKFEGEMVKFLDKKKEEQVPDRVIEMLVDYINKETCCGDSLLDLVTLNVLGSYLGSKSVVSYSLAEIEKQNIYDAGPEEVTSICVVVTMGTKVDEGLANWLKKVLTQDDQVLLAHLVHTPCWLKMLQKKPEVLHRLEVLLGYADKDGDDDYRVI